MENRRLLSFNFFRTFQNREEFFKRITDETDSFRRIVNLYLLLIIFSFFYGIVMGSYHSFLQAIAAAVKVPVLFSLVLLICFPAFFIIQFILGSKLRLGQMIAIILSGFVLTASIMIAFAPIVVFFLLTGSNYYFLQLLHISIFILSGIFGMKIIVDALKYSCEKEGIYPKMGVNIFRFWVVILAFVGIQLAWNLRPFLGDEGQPFKLFRQYEGNFYTALIYSFQQLTNQDQKKLNKEQKPINLEGDKDSTFLIFPDEN